MTNAQTPIEFDQAWDADHISDKFPSNVRHRDLEKYIAQLRSLGLKVSIAGKSLAQKNIYEIEWGKGEIRVLMWSQMHGDEPTATSSVIDMLAFLKKNENKIPWVKRLHDAITVRVIPMLNPDGADLYQRRNLQGIDINRDARNLRTPEANILMNRRNQFQPEIGFNLHNQQELTAAGNTTNQASISLLAVKANPETPPSEGQYRNERIASLMVSALNQFIPGNIGRYSDEYTESAFGDTFSDMGTPVILIETGGLYEKNEMYLVKMNFIALLTALQSLADESEKLANASLYKQLPENRGGRIFNYIFRGGDIVSYESRPAEPTDVENDEDYIEEPKSITVRENETPIFTKLDVSVNRQRRRQEISIPPIVIRRIGNLQNVRGLEEYNVSDFYIFSTEGVVRSGSRGALLFYRKTRNIDWTMPNPNKKHPADAIFARGRFLTGEKEIEKIK